MPYEDMYEEPYKSNPVLRFASAYLCSIKESGRPIATLFDYLLGRLYGGRKSNEPFIGLDFSNPQNIVELAVCTPFLIREVWESGDRELYKKMRYFYQTAHQACKKIKPSQLSDIPVEGLMTHNARLPALYAGDRRIQKEMDESVEAGVIDEEKLHSQAISRAKFKKLDRQFNDPRFSFAAAAEMMSKFIVERRSYNVTATQVEETLRHAYELFFAVDPDNKVSTERDKVSCDRIKMLRGIDMWGNPIEAGGRGATFLRRVCQHQINYRGGQKQVHGIHKLPISEGYCHGFSSTLAATIQKAGINTMSIKQLTQKIDRLAEVHGPDCDRFFVDSAAFVQMTQHMVHYQPIDESQVVPKEEGIYQRSLIINFSRGAHRVLLIIVKKNDDEKIILRDPNSERARVFNGMAEVENEINGRYKAAKLTYQEFPPETLSQIRGPWEVGGVKEKYEKFEEMLPIDQMAEIIQSPGHYYYKDGNNYTRIDNSDADVEEGSILKQGAPLYYILGENSPLKIDVSKASDAYKIGTISKNTPKAVMREIQIGNEPKGEYRAFKHELPDDEWLQKVKEQSQLFSDLWSSGFDHQITPERNSHQNISLTGKNDTIRRFFRICLRRPEYTVTVKLGHQQPHTVTAKKWENVEQEVKKHIKEQSELYHRVYIDEHIRGNSRRS